MNRATPGPAVLRVADLPPTSGARPPRLVWSLVSVGNGRPEYFWPMWLAVPGTVLLVVTCGFRAVGRLLR